VNRRPKSFLFTGILSVFAIFVMVLSGIPIVASVSPVIAPLVTTSAPSNATLISEAVKQTAQRPLSGYADQLPPIPQGIACLATFTGGLISIGIFGPACLGAQPSDTSAINAANAAVGAQNIITTLFNYLNETNAATANLNATFQELLSYYEGRAEAIVPYFLNETWNTTTYDEVAIDSGLVPSLEGVDTYLAHQQYQAWNATAGSWNNLFGPTGTFSGVQVAGFGIGWNPPFVSNGGTGGAGVFQVGQPVEFWTSGGTAFSGGANTTYFNLAPGGMVMNANYDNLSNYADEFGNWTVYDLTTHTSWAVPHVNYKDWATSSLPSNVTTETTVHNINQFSLLKLVCSGSATCSGSNSASIIETSGAYALRNISVSGPGRTPFGSNFLNSMVPLNILSNTSDYGNYMITPQLISQAVATPQDPAGTPVQVCITWDVTSNPDPCQTSNASTTGDSHVPSGGPGAVVAGNGSMFGFAKTAQALVNNTMIMAYDYWQTLRVITLNGTYSIPANCAIPTPSDAFPTATDFQNYKLSASNVEAVYLGYLNAVAREYGEVFTNQVGFCGDQFLGFSFNWTGSWVLALNITASVYIAGALNGTNVALNLNGTKAVNTTYNDVASWPAYNIVPSLIYPYEYQQNIPLNTIFPIPVNNPMIALLVNYKSNVEYGNPAFSPEWGVPTYVSLTGNGNYTNISGDLTNIPSGSNVTQGDAILISSCVLNGVPQNPCDISVTYFNVFAIGFIHSILPPIPFPPVFNGCGTFCRQAQQQCGTGAMNQWYDSWAGTIVTLGGSIFIYIGQAANSIPVIGHYLGTFFIDLGCIIGWILLIIVLVFIAWLILYIVRLIRG